MSLDAHIINLGLIIVYAIIAYILGAFVTAKYDGFRSSSTYLIFQTLLGHFLITSLYACLKSQLDTIHVYPLILSVIFICSNFSRSVHLQFKKTFLLELFVFSVLAYLLMAVRVFNLDGNVRNIHPDYAYYGGVADYMTQFGKETLILDPISISSKMYTYHFFEMWNASFFSSMTGHPGMKSVLLITYSFYIALTLLSIKLIASKFLNFKNNIRSLMMLLIMALFIIPIGGLYNKVFELFKLQKLELMSDIGIFTMKGMKLYPVYILSLLFIDNFINDQYRIKDFMMYVILSSVYLPATPFLIGLGILVKLQPLALLVVKRNLVYVLLALIIIALGLFIFRRDVLFYSIYEPLRYLACFPLIVLVLFGKHPEAQYFKRFVLSYLVGIGALLAIIKIGSPYITMFNDPSAFQLIANAAQPLAIILSIILSYHFLAGLSRIKSLALFLFIVSFYFKTGTHEKTFTSNTLNTYVDEVYLSENPKFIGYTRDKSVFLSNITSWHIYFDVPNPSTRWYSSNYFPIPLALPDVTQYDNVEGRKVVYNTIVNESSLYKYCSSRKSPIDSNCINSFLNHYDVSYIVQH